MPASDNFYLKLICESMVSEYGQSLTDYDKDLEMARMVLSRLNYHLDRRKIMMTNEQFAEWRQEFKKK